MLNRRERMLTYILRVTGFSKINQKTHYQNDGGYTLADFTSGCKS